jgi:ubiquinone/menaquinone biosynthesis C-methylase UbiE
MTLQDVQKNWEIFADTDPMWAILTEKEKYGNKWDKEEFFETGRKDLANAFDLLKSAGVNLRYGKALDFGCGVGRLTQALGDKFGEVHGVDIARPMIGLANSYNTKANVSYHHNAKDDLSLFQDGEFDFIYTLITLQHMEPQYAKRYIKEFIRILRPGGTCIFQMPSHVQKGVSSKFLSWVHDHMPKFLVPLARTMHLRKTKVINAVMEFHCIPKDELIDWIKQCGGLVRNVVADHWVDEHWASFTYVVTKPD